MKKILLVFMMVFLCACEPVIPVNSSENSGTDAEEIINQEIINQETIDEVPIINEPEQEPETTLPAELDPIPEEMEEPVSAQAEPEVQEDLKYIALTFDDGPSDHTDPLLDILEAYSVPATFCVVGRYVEGRKDTVKRAYDLGCEIVGHSWNHINFATINSQEIKDQLIDTHEIIESITGEMPRIYRPPYGLVSEKVRKASLEAGFSMLRWSVDPQDWKNRDAQTVYESVMKHVKDGSIIICHDTHLSTVQAMELLIPQLISEGYKLVTISELILYLDEEGLVPGEVYYGNR